MDNVTYYGQCRCCLVNGNHRNIMREYCYNNEREIYIDIFLDCFNLFLSTSNEISALICNSCINQLREANKFKTMVVNNEQKLLSMTNKDTIFMNEAYSANSDTEVLVKKEDSDIVKAEPETGDYDIDNGLQSDDSDFNMDCENIAGDFEDELTEDSLIEGEADLLSRFPDAIKLPTRDSLYKSACAGFIKQMDLLKGTVILPKMIENILAETESRSNKKIYITEKMAHILNASALLENSNATPFKSKNRFGFPCFYCRSVFKDLQALQDHQKVAHTRGDIRKALSTYGAECLVVYVDVTDLQCTVCGQHIPKLPELKTHLLRVHKKKMRPEFPDRVIPFKLRTDSDVYECQACGFTFETFGSIERHMNVHYRNYVCKECGTGFVTKYRLKVHTKSMHVGGSFPCEVCQKVFSTQQKHKNHVDTVHRLVKRFKCPHCSERFSEYFRRQKHLVEAHGGAPLRYKCNVCDKAFDRRYTLSRHLKRDHLEERDFHCQLCAYKCFTNNELRVHMVKHNGERIFECSVCRKSYARKKTLREHMRIHQNDRRFACAVCGQAFVQKCSLKGHVKTHHVEYNLPV